jgi:hypothetical protein
VWESTRCPLGAEEDNASRVIHGEGWWHDEARWHVKNEVDLNSVGRSMSVRVSTTRWGRGVERGSGHMRSRSCGWEEMRAWAAGMPSRITPSNTTHRDPSRWGPPHWVPSRSSPPILISLAIIHHRSSAHSSPLLPAGSSQPATVGSSLHLSRVGPRAASHGSRRRENTQRCALAGWAWCLCLHTLLKDACCWRVPQHLKFTKID